MTFHEPLNFYLQDPDVKLMLAFQQGDKAAFEALMRKFYPRVLNFIFRMIAQRDTAEDLTQEVFFRVYKSVERYRPQAQISTWVLTIARNLTLNELRRHQPAVSLDAPLMGEDGDMQRQLTDPRSVGADEELIRQEKVEAIKEAIASLSENQRTAVLLRRYEEFSYEQIAQTMNLSVEAVKSLLSRAKENLKVNLRKYSKNNETF
ncbi:MAG: sigma-70 family RNA polymerase sigma factor [Candidatus Omnitrophota bacterium]|nr:sigma-70 family RNA polymerase sigma factor [Candidatus Omnitrophota bacterium]